VSGTETETETKTESEDKMEAQVVNNDAVQAAIAAALANAAKAAPAQQQVAVQEQAPAPAVVVPGRPVTLEDRLASASTSADDWFRFDKAGIIIAKDDASPQDRIVGTVKLTDFKFLFGLAWKSAGVTQYAKSYDRARDAANGRAWQDTIAAAQRVDGTCRGDYNSTEFVVTLTEPVKLKSGKTFEAGARLKHQTSTTGDSPVVSWLSDMYRKLKAGEITGDTELKIVITNRRMERGQNKWGIPQIAMAA
jgi:hypothetical protein